MLQLLCRSVCKNQRKLFDWKHFVTISQINFSKVFSKLFWDAGTPGILINDVYKVMDLIKGLIELNALFCQNQLVYNVLRCEMCIEFYQKTLQLTLSQH